MFRSRTLSIQLFVSLLISLSILLIATVIISQSYISARKMALKHAQLEAEQVASRLKDAINQDNQQLADSLRLVSLDPLLSETAPAQRRQRLASLHQFLNMNPVASAIYIGYPNGDFMLLRRLVAHNDHSSRYRLQVINRTPDGVISRAFWEELDGEMKTVNHEEKPSYQFDPRSRNWFQLAQSKNSIVVTPPYYFFTTKELGISMALKTDSGAVIASDAAFADLSGLLYRLRESNLSRLALLSHDGQLLGLADQQKPSHLTTRERMSGELKDPVLNNLRAEPAQHQLRPFTTDSINWYGIATTSNPKHFGSWQLLWATPEEQILSQVLAGLHHQLLISISITFLFLVFGWQLGHRIAAPLGKLAKQLHTMNSLNFEHPLKISSSIREFQQLADLVNRMAGSINHFQQIAQTLAQESNHHAILRQVSSHLTAILRTKSSLVYRYDSHENCFNLSYHQQHMTPAPAHQISVQEGSNEVLCEQLKNHFADNQLYMVPLIGREGKLLGAFLLQMDELDDESLKNFTRFVDKVSGAVAIAIETLQHIEDQTKLLDAIIKLLADAIDTKSPFTGGHCQRVPVIAQMLLDAVEQSHEGPYAHFSLSATQRQEFAIAAWLHDCGKLTTPEHIVDKATKLETVYNRIHEIRTRFEILWRDAEIRYWQQHFRRPEEQPQQLQQLHQRHQQLIEQFALVARLNLGQERLDPEDKEQLKAIAQQSWLRHFDDRLGLSSLEKARFPESVARLPTREPLLSDRPEQIISWGNNPPPVQKDDPDNSWDFDMRCPEHHYNLGELHNLLIERGTLTDEERFIINNHIMQTIQMLSQLPLPDTMKHIPDIAGNHHEWLNGHGYPRKLDASQLLTSHRIIAIADIFEALSASDRPYHGRNKLSQIMNIMLNMAQEKHLDPELLRCFITSRIYLEYAQQYLQPDQLDDVDEAILLARLDALTPPPETANND